jgi:hypothetical protein
MKEMSIKDYENIGESFNEIIEKIVHLNVMILNSRGKTKTSKMIKELNEAKEMISSCRYEIENIMLGINKDASLITSFRKYREEGNDNRKETKE